MKAIIISGTPGTGKTKLAKALESKGLGFYVDINKIIKEKNLKVGFDKKRDCKIINEKKLVNIVESIIKNSKKTPIIESHIAHYVNPKLCKICFILRCNPKILKKRLKSRKYSKEKIEENCEAEKLDVILIEALEKKHKICEIDTSNKKIEDTLNEAVRILKGKRKCKYGFINWNI